MVFAFAYSLVRFILALFLRVEIEGLENVPEGGCLVVSNHLSWTDTAFIIYALPKQPAIWTMANESSVFNTGWKRWLLPKLHVFPVRRNRGVLDEQALERVYSILERGERVLVFPEGAYGRDGKLRPLKDGIGYFALNSGKPLLPIALAGSGRLRPFSRVRVVIGKPFIPKPPVLADIKARVRDAVDSVAGALGRLNRQATKPGGRGWLRVPFRSRSAKEQAAGVVAGDAGVNGTPAGDDQGESKPDT